MTDGTCEFVEFGETISTCEDDGSEVEVGPMTICLCDDHAKRLRGERGALA